MNQFQEITGTKLNIGRAGDTRTRLATLRSSNSMRERVSHGADTSVPNDVTLGTRFEQNQTIAESYQHFIIARPLRVL